MLRALKDPQVKNREHTRTDRQCKQRDRNPKKEPERNATDQKH